MSVPLSLVLSDDLHAEIARVSRETGMDAAEIFRKSFQILLEAHRAKAKGLHLALVDPDTGLEHTKFVGY